MPRSMGPFAEVVRVAELIGLEQPLRKEVNRPTRDFGLRPEPIAEVGERVARFHVEREGLATAAGLLAGPYQQVSIESDGMRPQIRLS